MSTQRISSNATLALAIFFPVFWTVFFGSVTVALFLYDTRSGNLPVETAKWVMLAIFLSGVLVLYFTIFQLKRVELDEQFVYVTNYFKTYRYPYSSVEKLEVSEFLFLAVGVIRLRQAGRFGRRITFVMAKVLFDDYIQRHPEVAWKLNAGDSTDD